MTEDVTIKFVFPGEGMNINGVIVTPDIPPGSGELPPWYGRSADYGPPATD